MRQQGYLWVTTTDAGARRQARLVEQQRGWGMGDVELMDGDSARRRFPHLGGNVLSARYRAGDGWLAPRRLTAAYAEGADRAAFVTDTAVTSIVVEGGRVAGVRT